MTIFYRLLYLGVFFLSVHLQAQRSFTANLAGRNEVIPVVTMASGSINLEIVEEQMIITGSFSGLSDDLATDIMGGAHLHLGYAGQNGSIIQSLVVTPDADLRGGTFEAANNTFSMSPELFIALDERSLYVNIHSLSAPGGEIRGQFQAADADSYYTSNLFGSNVIPSVVSRGHGALAIEIDGTSIRISGSFADLEGTFDAQVNGGADIHLFNAGANGAIYLPLVASVAEDGKSGVFTIEDNTFDVLSTQLSAFSARGLRADIYTSLYPAGEIRGLVVGQPAILLRSRLSGSNQVPVLNTIGDGMVITEIFPDSSLVISGSFNRLTDIIDLNIGGGMHLHQGLAGESGPVLIPLSIVPNEDLKGGTLTAPANIYKADAATLEALLDRSTYLNIHTLAYPDGELRGQNLPEGNAFFQGFVSGNSSAPARASTGTGMILGEWRGDQLTLSGSFSNLRSPINTDIQGGIHLHAAMIGSNGPIAFPLNLLPDESSTGGSLTADANTFTLSEDQVQQLMERGMYINVHTQDTPSGEVRAQLLHEATTFYIAPLSGAGQTPPFETAAFGTVALEISEGRGYLSGSFAGMDSDYNENIGSHIHVGMAGQDSDVLFPLQATLAGDKRSGTYQVANNILAFTFNQRSDLSLRKNYVNIHTAARPGGALRGQLLPPATAYFTASLLAANEPEPIVSEGRGSVKLELTGNTLKASGSFRSLSGLLAQDISGGAHIHVGRPGTSGEVVFPLTASQTINLLGGLLTPQDNTFTLTEDQIEALFDEQYYINIHSTLATGGEIRSQILPEVNFYPTKAVISSPEDGATIVLEGEAATAFTASWLPAVDSNYLSYTWQLSAAPDFSTLLVSQSVGNELSFSTTIGVVDNLLALAGIEVGNSVNLYHRVIASDGALIQVGTGAQVTLQRGEVTGIREFLPTAEWSLKAFPNPARSGSRITVQTKAAKSTEAQLVLFNSIGQQTLIHNYQLQEGTQQQTISLPDISPGIYYLNLKVGRQLLPAVSILVER